MKKYSFRTTMPFINDGALSPLTDKSVPLNIDRDYERRQDFGKQETDHTFMRDNDSEPPYGYIGDYFEGEIDISVNAPQSDKETVVLLDNNKRMTFNNLSQSEIIRQLKEQGLKWRYITEEYKNKLKVASNDNVLVSMVSDILPSCYKVESLSLTSNKKEIGSCFYFKQNYLLTCSHVISKNQEDAKNISLYIIDGGKRNMAKLIDIDYNLDIAILYCDSIKHNPLEIKSIKGIEIGSEIICVGSPYGYDNNVTKGILSSVDREIDENKKNYFFMDLSVFPGSSGGPIIDLADGKAFGLAAVIIESVGTYGINAGIPIDICHKRFAKIFNGVSNEYHTK